MTDADWQKVKDVFGVALQLKPRHRQKYVNAACGENSALRNEVETLLASYQPDFIETPAVAEVADVIVTKDKSSDLLKGQLIRHYKIVRRIGKGGMGEVYLAEDIKLNRQVALKVLSAKLDSDKRHFQRFVREAQSASALNHPNICTIYEINDEDGSPFIAMEHIEGETLAKKIRKQKLNLQEILDIAIQIAAALTAAHRAKVIHRDIKTENIMVRPDGLVKVLDFGLAKLTEKSPVVRMENSKISTMPFVSTNPGMVLGTVGYMSPEQARGIDVDARSDIFSFGVLLYEMLSGKLPFKGENEVDVIGSILHKEPVPLNQSAPNVPHELERIVSKTLRKDREERHQTVADLLGELKDLNQNLDLIGKTDDPGFRLTESSERAGTTSNAEGQIIKTNPSVFSSSSISETLLSGFKLYPKGSALVFSIILLALIVSGTVFYKLIRSSQTPDSFQTMRLAKLTSTGNAEDGEIAISPDGKYVVYALEEAGQQSLWVKQTATSGNVQIVSPAEVAYSGLTFSRDGNYIYYAVAEKKGIKVIYMIPTLGGNARKLIADADGPVTFSPDGSQMAFVRGETSLTIAKSDGSAEQTLAAASEGNRWDYLAWSPDGKKIVSSVFSSVDSNIHLVEVSMKGAEKPLASPPWLRVTGLTWLPDSSGLLLSGRDLETKLSQIWFISYPDGKLHRITNDLSSYQGLSLTADGKTAVSVQQNWLSNIWTAPDTDAGIVQKITSEVGRDEGMSGVASTPNGIVYTTRITGTQDLWFVNKNGSENRQLTFNVKSNFSPTVSPDGRFIVFVSDRTNNLELWRMDLDGGNPKQLTATPGIEGEPAFSPDGRWIVYQHTHTDNKTTIWKMDIDGDNKVQLTNVDSRKPTVSPDGKFIACDYGEAGAGASIKLAIIPFNGGLPTKLLDLPLVVKSRNFRWSSDGKALIYVDSRNRVYNLWSQPLDSSSPKQLTDYKTDRIYRFDLSRDGKGFALARGNESSDVVLISNFR